MTYNMEDHKEKVGREREGIGDAVGYGTSRAWRETRAGNESEEKEQSTTKTESAGKRKELDNLTLFLIPAQRG